MTATVTAQSQVWRRLQAGALAAMVITHLVGTLVIRGEYPRFALILEVPLLALALWVATGRRWAAPVATAITALLAVYTAIGAGSRLTELEGAEVLAAILFFGLGLLAAVAGVASTVVSRRQQP